MSTTFEDPFAGTPQAAIRRQIGIDNASPLEKARRGEIFVENGLFGMKDIDGTVLYPPKYYYIGRCRDYVLFIKPNWEYCKMSRGCNESGYMQEEDRPYVKDGKVGFKTDGKVIIPAEYEFIESAFGDNTVFKVIKDGREYYINDKDKEVLTRIRCFEEEDSSYSPFWLCTDSFDFFTAMRYVGHEDETNPNVVKVCGEWVELERYCRDEILRMVFDPEDDLALTQDKAGTLCDKFSYEYSFYFAQASGDRPLAKCLEQLEKMKVFSNSWHFTAKIWQAPGENVTAKDLRGFYEGLTRKDVIGTPSIAVGHSDSLKPGEVRILFITNYYERCFPPLWEFEWYDKCHKMPLTKLRNEIPELKKAIEKDVLEEYREDDLKGLVRDCIEDINYEKGSNWEKTAEALDFFKGIGSRVEYALRLHMSNAYDAAKENHAGKSEFFLRAALWSLENGSRVNVAQNSETPLDIACKLSKENLGDGAKSVLKELHDALISRGALTFAQRNENDDYRRELELILGL